VTPYYDADGITLYCADCRDVLPTIAPGSVDLVLTDPPYGMRWDGRVTVGPNTTGRGAKITRHYGATISGDDEPFDPAPFLHFPDVIRWGFRHFSDRVPPGSILVWLKRYDSGFGSFLSDADTAWMKGGHGVYCHRDMSLSLENNNRLHPTQKPVGLMRWILDRWSKPGDLILDPYMGSGPIARACADLGRRYIGIEVEERYCEIAARRLSQCVLPIPA
jgi:DNA modification methylase